MAPARRHDHGIVRALNDECLAQRSSCDALYSHLSVRDAWQQQGETLVRVEPCFVVSHGFCHANPKGQSGWTCKRTAEQCAASAASVGGASCASYTSWPR